ncbi:MAG: DUF1489 family protein [Alphaproteobacteria bacterium]
MKLHLIKLSVGSESLADLKEWQGLRLKDMKAKGRTPELVHVTRQMPKRADELLDGGSIFWVVKGWIVARQKLLELRPMKRDGVPHCGIVYDKKVIPVQWRQRRAFQGWRYLEGKDAPRDRAEGGLDDLPEDVRLELAALGLL